MAFEQDRETLLDLIGQQLPDNTEELIRPVHIRQVLNAMVYSGLIKSTDTLSVNQLRGGTHLKATLAARDAISPALRVVGMGCVVFNPAGPAEIGANITLEEATYVLMRDSTGPITALINAEPTTGTTTKARWVQVSGSDEEKTLSYLSLQLEDSPLVAGDVRKWTFADGQTRLLEIKRALPRPGAGGFNPNPDAAQGLDNDTNADYRLFAALAGGISAQEVMHIVRKYVANDLLTVAEGLLLDARQGAVLAGLVEQARATVRLSDTQTADFTLSLAHAGCVVPVYGLVPVTVSVPNHNFVPLPIGTVIELSQDGPGKVTLTGAYGVTLDYFQGLSTAGQHAAVGLRKKGPNSWVITGGVA